MESATYSRIAPNSGELGGEMSSVYVVVTVAYESLGMRVFRGCGIYSEYVEEAGL